MGMEHEPLVSVCVICYNSSEFIIDTLESIKSQTYQNIELIVSDDKSPDNTVAICNEWIEKNRERFVRTEVIVPEQNTGTSGNYNRALFASKGNWIKFIDGDDVLLENCIDENVNFINSNDNAKVIFSNVEIFQDKIGDPQNKLFFNDKKKTFFEKDAISQLQIALAGNPMPSASFFVNAEMIKENSFDERFRLLEDAPKWIDLLEKGYRFYYFDRVTAGYRDCQSVSQNKTKYFSPIYVESLFQYLWTVRLPLIRKYNNEHAYNVQRKQLLKIELAFALLNNKRTFCHNIVYGLIKVFISLFVKYRL